MTLGRRREFVHWYWLKSAALSHGAKTLYPESAPLSWQGYLNGGMRYL